MEQNPLVLKLCSVAHLSEDEIRAVRELCTDVHEVAAKHDIISEGDRPKRVHLMLDGWAARYKMVESGGRQITAFLIPGDFCDIHVTILGQMDHSILALTPCKVGYVPGEQLDALTRDRSNLTRALWWTTLVDEAVLREWVVNNGRRDAYAAIAHVMCEMHVRMKAVGLTTDDVFDLPLTQEDLADAAGLTPVHTNRVLQKLRAEGLIELKKRVLTIRDVGGLRQAAGFDPDYLHAKTGNRQAYTAEPTGEIHSLARQ